MDATAERQVPVHLPVEAHLERVGELGGVEVGGAEVDHHVVAGGDGLATDLRVLACPTDAGGHGGLPAQELLDRVGDHVRVLDDLASVIGVLGQEGEEAGERVGDRVEPGGEQDEADGEDLVASERAVLGLEAREQREDVVARLRPRSSSTASK